MILELADGSFLDFSTLVTARPAPDGSLALTFSGGHAAVLKDADAAAAVEALRKGATKAAPQTTHHGTAHGKT